jgi:hypothetical protein
MGKIIISGISHFVNCLELLIRLFLKHVSLISWILDFSGFAFRLFHPLPFLNPIQSPMATDICTVINRMIVGIFVLLLNFYRLEKNEKNHLEFISIFAEKKLKKSSRIYFDICLIRLYLSR